MQAALAHDANSATISASAHQAVGSAAAAYISVPRYIGAHVVQMASIVSTLPSRSNKAHHTLQTAQRHSRKCDVLLFKRIDKDTRLNRKLSMPGHELSVASFGLQSRLRINER
jgi:hypothetical protein